MERKKGKHLTLHDRNLIERMLRKGYKKTAIADVVGCCLATVYNEINRATYMHTNPLTFKDEKRYAPEIAHEKYLQNLKGKGPKEKLVKEPEQLAYLENLLYNQKYSPAAALMQMKKDEVQFEYPVKSVNTIYSAIRKGRFEKMRVLDLPEMGRKRPKKKKYVRRNAKHLKGTSIEERPDVVDERTTFGNWEMDTVVGKVSNKKNILVLTERKTRYEILEYMKSHTEDEVRKALNRIEKRFGSVFYGIFLSITVDNGMEFQDYEAMEKALYRVGKRTDIFYCHPNSPFERGSNENSNKLVRRFFPKGTDFDRKLNRTEVKNVETWMNNYPRKILGGKTPAELFAQELQAAGFT